MTVATSSRAPSTTATLRFNTGWEAPYDESAFLEALIASGPPLVKHKLGICWRQGGCRYLARTLAESEGITLAEKWNCFERRTWPGWSDRLRHDRDFIKQVAYAPWTAVLSGLVQPSYGWIVRQEVLRHLDRLPAAHRWRVCARRFEEVMRSLPWIRCQLAQHHALGNAVRILIHGGYDRLEQIQIDDVREIYALIGPKGPTGRNVIEATLCSAGVFKHEFLRTVAQNKRQAPSSIESLLARANMPPAFRAVTHLYLEARKDLVSDRYGSLVRSAQALGIFWQFIGSQYPEVADCREVRSEHTRAFIPYMVEYCRQRVRQGYASSAGANTAQQRLITICTFFADLGHWGADAESPLHRYVPPVNPFSHRKLRALQFNKTKRRLADATQARMIEFERALPHIRALTLSRWQSAEKACQAQPADKRLLNAERGTFWDWALLELLLQSGLRIEEACELTTLDILKRRDPSGAVYYLLHIKPSKFDRARVIPIGDGLGHVIAEMIRHVKQLHGTDHVPFCTRWDHHERRVQPRAPYLLQGITGPNAVPIQSVRQRIVKASLRAHATAADGSALYLRPHDCRRLFATEHLNNHVPVHVIQALLGHESVDTTMIYAKLYPHTLIAEYRGALRGRYEDTSGKEAFRSPTLAEWEAFSSSCNLRDMGTHLCALPAGGHCARGLVCLGCSHAQPKRSALPLFQRMLASHQASLARARTVPEPAGQIAARELELDRIRSAARRAGELSSDVAAALEAAA